MFGTAFGSQISWLLPGALVALVAGLWFSRRAPRTNKVRAGVLLWSGWLVVTVAVLSYMQGTVHPYYAVALAPAIAGSIAVAGRELWHGRVFHSARGVLSVMIAITAVWSWYLLHRDVAGWQPWLSWAVLIGGILGATILATSVGRLKKYAAAGLLIGSLAALGGTGGYTFATVASAHTGAIPAAGPVGLTGGPGGGFDGRPGGGFDGGSPSGETPGGVQLPSGADVPGGGPPENFGQGSGFGRSAATDPALVTVLEPTTSRWSAAVVGDQAAAGYILSTHTAVMSVGGWSGSDDSPTLAQFKAYVEAEDIRYFLSAGGVGGGQGQGRGSSSATEIAAWVTANYSPSTAGGVTLYDLTKPAG